jgi:hypothetical protein
MRNHRFLPIDSGFVNFFWQNDFGGKYIFITNVVMHEANACSKVKNQFSH